MTRISRKFNYTQRVRIPASKVHVEVERSEDGQYRGVVKKLDLSDHGRHTEDVWRAANVVVEARRVSTASYHRQGLGSVGEVQRRNTIVPIELPEFQTMQKLHFASRSSTVPRSCWVKSMVLEPESALPPIERS